MEFAKIYASEYIKITKKDAEFYIESFKPGLELDKFNKIVAALPQIKITNFMAIKSSLISASPKKLFGETKSRLTISISNDGLKAYLTLCVDDAELAFNVKNAVIREIITFLDEEGITFGVKKDLYTKDLINNKQFLIAEGEPPIDGVSSEITMYKIQEAQPQISEDGNANHYELSLINQVHSGDWLGERTEPTLGIEGTSVQGKPIKPKPGNKFPLLYDKKYIAEYQKDNLTTLHAKINGAVYYIDGRISISNFLELPNDVDYSTGNIKFDGHVNIKGTVLDGFSVEADKDIEIHSLLGVGAANSIISNEGNIYVRGGVSGKSKLVIKAKNNIYLKFVSDAEIICEGTVNIGFYCLNSKITATEVILDSSKSQIIGGEINVKNKVIASIYGSPREKQTVINIEGLDRDDAKEKLKDLIEELETTKSTLLKLKQDVSQMSFMKNLTPEQSKKFDKLIETYYKTMEYVSRMEIDRKKISSSLRTKGDGELKANKSIYPGTCVKIKEFSKNFQTLTGSTSLYLKENELFCE